MKVEPATVQFEMVAPPMLVLFHSSCTEPSTFKAEAIELRAQHAQPGAIVLMRASATSGSTRMRQLHGLLQRQPPRRGAGDASGRREQ